MTPAELLAATAADMRAVAGSATDEIGSSSWGPAAAADDSYEAYATAWDPDMARAVAVMLEDLVAEYADLDPAKQRSIFTGEPARGALVCQAWWKSRGREPVAP